MKHVVRKAYFDFEKEEKFLNEMAANGKALVGYSWCKYVFEDTPKGEYIYRLQLLEHPVNHQESQDYLRFMEETGAEVVATYNRWVYFRKKAAGGKFVIYSDNRSKLIHYRRIRNLFLLVLAFNLFAGLLNWYFGNITVSSGNIGFNFYVAIFSFVVVVLILIFLIIPLNNKIAHLEKEKDIRE